MARSLPRLVVTLLLPCLVSTAFAQGYVDDIDVAEIPEVDVVFKCHGDTQTPEAALFGLAHRLTRRRGRVYSVLMSPTESQFGYVRAPFSVSAPAFYERDGVIYACVTVQSVASLQGSSDENVPEPGADAPDTIDDALDDAVDQQPIEDGNQIFDGNSWIDDPNIWSSDPNDAPDYPGYEEDDDLRIPGLPMDPARGQIEPPDVDDDDSFSFLNPNNETDRPFFDPNDSTTLPPLVPPGPAEPDLMPAPAPAPSADPTLVEPDTATAGQAQDKAGEAVAPAGDDMANDPIPVEPGLPTSLPGLTPPPAPAAAPNPTNDGSVTAPPVVPNAAQEAVLDEQTDVLPSPDSAHGPVLHPDSKAALEGDLSEPVLQSVDDEDDSGSAPAVEQAPSGADDLSADSSEGDKVSLTLRRPWLASLLSSF